MYWDYPWALWGCLIISISRILTYGPPHTNAWLSYKAFATLTGTARQTVR